MGRKTVADLEEELKVLKEQLANMPQASEEQAQELALAKAENEELKVEVVKAKSHSAESELRLLQELESMAEGNAVLADGKYLGCVVLSPDEYREYSSKQGLIMGRKPNQKYRATIEELRAYINSDWTPSMFMEKTGMDERDLQALIWRLSEAELRDKPIRLDFKRDLFGREG